MGIMRCDTFNHVFEYRLDGIVHGVVVRDSRKSRTLISNKGSSKAKESPMARERLIVTGGDAAGMNTASQARRRKTYLEIIAFERGPYTSYSS
jgi:hypothetical protein